jgi:hypothetical protein
MFFPEINKVFRHRPRHVGVTRISYIIIKTSATHEPENQQAPVKAPLLWAALRQINAKTLGFDFGQIGQLLTANAVRRRSQVLQNA